MGRALNYIKKEKEYYGKMFYNINSAITEIAPYINSDELESRKYVTRVPVLKRYIELLSEMEEKEEKDGILGFLNDDSHIGELEGFKRKNHDELEQLEKCSKCVHLNCSPGCKTGNCLGCRPGSWLALCDHKRMSVRLHDSFNLDLTNNRTGRRERYKVLATLEDVIKDRQYIIIQGISSGEKFVLYYYPGIVEDSYGEIHDEEEFDFVISTYENIER